MSGRSRRTEEPISHHLMPLSTCPARNRTSGSTRPGTETPVSVARRSAWSTSYEMYVSTAALIDARNTQCSRTRGRGITRALSMVDPLEPRAVAEVLQPPELEGGERPQHVVVVPRACNVLVDEARYRARVEEAAPTDPLGRKDLAQKPSERTAEPLAERNTESL